MEDSSSNDNEIRNLLQRDGVASDNRRITKTVLNRARRQVGQKDTLAFVFVKIWAAFAKILAPIFALSGEKQAAARRRQKAPYSSIAPDPEQPK